jgi:hypothetical protein
MKTRIAFIAALLLSLQAHAFYPIELVMMEPTVSAKKLKDAIGRIQKENKIFCDTEGTLPIALEQHFSPEGEPMKIAALRERQLVLCYKSAEELLQSRLEQIDDQNREQKASDILDVTYTYEIDEKTGSKKIEGFIDITVR